MGRNCFARPLAAAVFLGLLCLVAALEDGSHLPDASIATGGPQTLAASSSDSRGGQLPAAAEPPLDDSVRCRLAGICDSPLPACNGTGADTAEQGQDPLACINDDAGRAAAVLDAARHAWSGYRDCAWGEDELQPLSCSGVHWLNLSLTMVDSLDTLYLLGMRREFEEAAEWLSTHLDVGAPGEVNLFETTIRVLGGLLSAQALSAGSHPALSRRLAEKAAELGARLMPAFSSPSGVPYSDVNLRTGEASPPSWGHISSLSEMCSVSLEFTYLSRITGHAPFEEVPLRVHELLEAHAASAGGLLGQYFDPLTGKAHREHRSTITLGARSDSYYEYLLKQWLLTGKSDGALRERYVRAMRSMRARLLRRTAPVGRPGLWYVAEQMPGGGLSGKMDHLVCFLPGLLALGDLHNVSTAHSTTYGTACSSSEDGGKHADGGGESCDRSSSSDGSASQGFPESGAEAAQPATPGAAAGAAASVAEDSAEGMPDLHLAHELALSCYELYRRTPSGLAPEIAHFADNSALEDFPNKHVHDVGHGDFSIKPNDAHNLLRPESVESFFLLWKVTGDPLYKLWAWQVFRAFEKWARVRPEHRQEQCSSCLAEAAAQAARLAAAATAEADRTIANSSNVSIGVGDAGAAGTAEARRAVAVAAAAEVLQRQLRGDDVCPACSSTGGYSSLDSVLAVPPPRRDKMESFFLAETLKYLYLIFVEPPDRCLHPSCQRAAAEAAAAAAVGQPDSSTSSGGAAAHAQQQRQREGESEAGHPVQLLAAQQGQQPGALLPLHRFVITTEAHPLPVVGSAAATEVARVLDPDSPLLRPFDQGECSVHSAAGGDSGGATPAQQRAAAALAAAKKAAAAAHQRASQGSASQAQLLESALGHMLQRLADAAAGVTGQPGSSNAGGRWAPGLVATEGAAGEAGSDEEETDPYEDACNMLEEGTGQEEEESDPYEDPPDT